MNFERSAKAQAWILFGPLFLSAIMALLLPRFGVFGFMAVALSYIGGYLVLRSKLSQKLRTKVLVEWGASGMTSAEKIKYFAGYALVGISFVLACAIRIELLP